MHVRGSRDGWKVIVPHTRICVHALVLLSPHCGGYWVKRNRREAVLRGRGTQPFAPEDACQDQENGDNAHGDQQGTRNVVHPAYCQYCKTSLPSSLAIIVAVLSAPAARIAQSIGKGLAHLVEALRACRWNCFGVMFVCYCRVSELPKTQGN
jgi:hypothetical protein